MARTKEEYGPGVQYIPKTTPLEDILYLLKRDGAVFVRDFLSCEDVDKAHEEIKERLDQDVAWDGLFFPKETQRAPSMVARSPTYTKTQMMNPLFQAVCEHFLTTRTWFWWGDTRKESVSKPYVSSTLAIRIGPGGKAQPLHRDDFINHTYHEEISEWDDKRDKKRETAIGLMVAGSKITKENGGTQFIPGSHLWGTDRETPPSIDDCVFTELEKGDALILFSSVYHGGGNNTTSNEDRLMFSTFVTRGYLRQEENQFLAVPQETVRQYDRDIQNFIGYSISDPACGQVEQIDPIYTLYPELLKTTKPTDF